MDSIVNAPNQSYGLWWLPRGMDTAGLSIMLAHDPAVIDEVEPLENDWYQSVDEAGTPSAEAVLYPLSSIREWRRRWSDLNVHRSIAFYDSDGTEALHGPFLVDIDNSQEDVEAARNIAIKVVAYFTEDRAINDGHIRLFFSGRKGFHVEIAPTALGIEDWSGPHDMRCACDACAARRGLLSQIGPTFETTIDPIHRWIRIENSLNGWLDESGRLISRRRIELTRDELERCVADEIVQRSTQEANGRHPEENEHG